MNYGTLSSDYDAGYDDGVDTSRADTDTLDAITALLDGREWTADTLEAIAELVRMTGRIVRDVEDELA